MLRWIPAFKHNRGLGLVGLGSKACPPHKLVSPWRSSPRPQTDCSSCPPPIPACLLPVCPLPAPCPSIPSLRVSSVSHSAPPSISLPRSSLLPLPSLTWALSAAPSHLSPGFASLLLLSPLPSLLLRSFSAPSPGFSLPPSHSYSLEKKRSTDPSPGVIRGPGSQSGPAAPPPNTSLLSRPAQPPGPRVGSRGRAGGLRSGPALPSRQSQCKERQAVVGSFCDSREIRNAKHWVQPLFLK